MVLVEAGATSTDGLNAKGTFVSVDNLASFALAESHRAEGKRVDFSAELARLRHRLFAETLPARKAVLSGRRPAD